MRDVTVVRIVELDGLAHLLHHDADHDLIREKTDLTYESDRLAPRSTL